MRKEVIQVGLGIVALLFRQTNVSWVAVFPMGLAVVQGIKALSHDGAAPKGPQSFMEVVQHAWNEAFIYDPSVAEAWLDDYIKCGISIAIVAALNLGKIITPLYPALMILNVFVAFVAWNGGVVLGMIPFIFQISPDPNLVQVTSQTMSQRFTRPKCSTSGRTCYSSRGLSRFQPFTKCYMDSSHHHLSQLFSAVSSSSDSGPVLPS